MKFPLLLIVFFFIGTNATLEAQLFSRFGRAQVGSSNCPGGVCPTATLGSNRGHWSFPGDLDEHLEGTHGVSTAGMSRQQKLDLHDSLHEGTAPAVRRSSEVVVRGNSQYAKEDFRVGGRDHDGALITSIGVSPAPIPRSVPVANTFGL